MKSISKMSKSEIRKRETWRCEHGHNGLTHPGCYDSQKKLRKLGRNF